MCHAVEPADVYGSFNAYKHWLGVLSANVLRAKVEPFLRQAAKSVDSLVIWGSVSSVELYQLSVLNNVEILTIWKTDSCGPLSYELHLFPRFTELRIFRFDVSGSGLRCLYRAWGMTIVVVE
ncbi:hypothetical protein AURDEDRAFT_166431 [Auricularia subglabra TFB-10046 SS5]|uniref:Uncharacterized protein n=1 Tax=Auricularia subglabra (strain TFB-10046 / SS5) TaxID=717982 RepID=J0LKX9_AURST|nr:hypothetical protein AURDEDRAFT_166431 [Auricularia subglabra TFB-10046 SS5]